MTRRFARALVVCLAPAWAACATDVSTSTSYGGPGAIVTGLDAEPLAVAAGVTGVYWVESSYLGYAPMYGGSAMSIAYPANPGRVAADDTNVYFTDLGPASAPRGTVYWCPQSDCVTLSDCQLCTTPGVIISQPGKSLGGESNGIFEAGFLTVDSGQLYWTTGFTPEVELWTCPVTGCRNPLQLTGAGIITPKVVRDGTIYGFNADSTEVVSCAVAACAEAFGVKPFGGLVVSDFTVDNGLLYFAIEGDVSNENELIGVCTLPACLDVAILLNTGVDAIAGLAESNGVLYFGLGNAFAECVAADCQSTLRKLGLPASPVVSWAPVPITAGGAYAYSHYETGHDSIGIPSDQVPAITYLPLFYP